MSKKKIGRYFAFAWGGSAGFVVGAALAALLYRRLGWWPSNEAHLRHYLSSTNSSSTNLAGDLAT